MDKDFLNSIQPNFDYLLGSSIWKNDLTPFSGGNFVVSNFNDLYVGSAGITFDKLKLSDNFAFAGNIGTIDFKAVSVAKIDYLKNGHSDLVYGKGFLDNTTFPIDGNPNWHVIDANVNRKDLRSYNLDDLYTTSAVAYNEAGGNLSHFLSPNNMSLQSVTYQDFKNNGNVFTVTSPFGDVATVSLQTGFSNSTSYLGCSHPAIATLTNATTGQTITLCVDMLKSNDFGLAVYGIAFSSSCTIFTEDKCLGYAFSKFYSFCPSGNTYWENKMNIKNNFLCSYNH